MEDDFLRAIALVMVIEGMLPFLSPSRLRISFLRIAAMDDKSLRRMGFVTMIAGVVLLKFSGT